VVKLAGAENLWRIRVGNYRVVYEIHDDRLTYVLRKRASAVNWRIVSFRSVLRKRTAAGILAASRPA
jgi:hypothetical protein